MKNKSIINGQKKSRLTDRKSENGGLADEIAVRKLRDGGLADEIAVRKLRDGGLADEIAVRKLRDGGLAGRKARNKKPLSLRCIRKIRAVIAITVATAMIITLLPQGRMVSLASCTDAKDSVRAAEENISGEEESTESISGKKAIQDGQSIYNEYIKLCAIYGNRITLGTTGGAPKKTSDDNRPMLYGFPKKSMSITTIVVDGYIYIHLV